MVTRQQKIQAGVAQLLFDWLDCKDMGCIDNDDAARNILSYLDSQGLRLPNGEALIEDGH